MMLSASASRTKGASDSLNKWLSISKAFWSVPMPGPIPTAEKELRTLQKRDKELDEATQLAEKVIEERKTGNKENDTFPNINDDSDAPSL